MTTIREAKKEEVEKIHNLYLSLLESYPDAYVDTYGPESKKGSAIWEEKISDTKTKVFVAEAEKDNELIGLVTIKYSKFPYIGKMGVLPKFKGTGVGLKLLDACSKYSKDSGAKEMRLYVIMDRKETMDFYTKYGFKTIEIFKDDVQNYQDVPKDVSLMSKPI